MLVQTPETGLGPRYRLECMMAYTHPGILYCNKTFVFIPLHQVGKLAQQNVQKDQSANQL